jgi:hypothetical protein
MVRLDAPGDLERGIERILGPVNLVRRVVLPREEARFVKPFLVALYGLQDSGQ